ncbi:MAG: PLDc N-terminal domain-containing protein [Ectothiorhodospiraceae bacterium]|nr:PLDc N-terminal domain-containing protein [Chromatiales bacterium]MCP5156929.1 PLDc N-terminal domain-containing protein [Ectothiorhodospiraceae bacterium]
MTFPGWLLVGAATALAVFTAAHVLLYKRDPRAAFGWVAVCFTFPVAGPLLYCLFGINRIHTRARRLGLLRLHLGYERSELHAAARLDPSFAPEFASFAAIADAVARRPLVAGNRAEPLANGEEAFPAMLEAIAAAERTIYLATYLFQLDAVGRRFVAALGAAVERGVTVVAILDGVGELYGLPHRAGKALAARGVRVARFLPPTLVPPSLFMNLRNHRKLLVVDGVVGFTGGMNIAARHMVTGGAEGATADLHFRLRGPVVGQLEHVFAEDWQFCTGEMLVPGSTLPRSLPGRTWCRAVVDGPNEDLDKLTMILLGVFGNARHRIVLVTPYFVPGRELISALQTAALRGVQVDVVIPRHSNLPFVDWATRNMLWELVARGVRVHLQDPPFDHTKLYVVDDFYALIGSANLDARSLRLNFELMIELYDRGAVAELEVQVTERLTRSAPITLRELDARPLPVRIRDAVAWLFSPYL